MKACATKSRTPVLHQQLHSLNLRAGDPCPNCGSALIEEPKQTGFEEDWESIIGRLRCIPCARYYGGIVVSGIY